MNGRALLALAVDAALLIVVAEALWLLLRGGGGAARPALFNLLAGFALLLALQGALAGRAWPGLLACLALAGIAHLAELALRLQSRR